MVEAFGFEISVTDRNPGMQWLDLSNKFHIGPVVVVEAESDDLWATFDVKSDSSTWFTNVNLAILKPEKEELLFLQRKTDMYQVAPNHEGMIYHPIGFGYIDTNGRLRKRRITESDVASSSHLSTLVAEFKRLGIAVEKHEDVTGKSPPNLEGKLCTLVEYGNWELVVVAYIGEKVAPLLGLL